LLRECETLDGCATGDAKITGGHALPARHVIHAVGPIWRGGTHGEADLLASCYQRSLEVAHQAHCQSIAFPAISCGIYHFPANEAVQIAVATVLRTVPRTPGIARVVFACFDDTMLARYEAVLRRHQAPPSNPV
jgi:O-acetyl-ADP-ribose deacetylase (regulator of RNase III)